MTNGASGLCQIGTLSNVCGRFRLGSRPGSRLGLQLRSHLVYVHTSVHALRHAWCRPYIHGAATINIVTAGTFVAVSCGTALFVCESYGRQDAETRLAARRLNHGLNTAANPRLYSARAHDDA